jgi:hypothetical protein
MEFGQHTSISKYDVPDRALLEATFELLAALAKQLTGLRPMVRVSFDPELSQSYRDIKGYARAETGIVDVSDDGPLHHIKWFTADGEELEEAEIQLVGAPSHVAPPSA